MLETGGCIPLLMRGVTRSGGDEGYGSAASTPEWNSKPSKNTLVRCSVAVEAPFSFHRLLRPLMNGLGQEMRLPAAYLYGRPV